MGRQQGEGASLQIFPQSWPQHGGEAHLIVDFVHSYNEYTEEFGFWLGLREGPFRFHRSPAFPPPFSSSLGKLFFFTIQQAAEHWDPFLWMLMPFSISMEPKQDTVFL